MKSELVERLLPGLTHDREYYEKLYPERNLGEKAIVTRYAPSPTGFVHIGNIFQLYISSKMARQTGGIVFLRIEDTDQERRVENGISKIIRDVESFGLTFDEGAISETEEKGAYGPYIQSHRKEIYQTYAKDLLLKGLAYPDFTTKEELEKLRKEQETSKRRIGYYGKWARSRFLTEEEIEEKLDAGLPYIIRLKSTGDFNRKVVVEDAIRGKLEFPEDDIDQVLIKNDGLPTYHFAHAIDDHLMHTTHVIRGDEWVSSLPVHIGLHKALGFTPPIYCHIPPLNKKDGNSIRKLSKRKDPEMAVSYYHEMGIPVKAVMLYLATVSNSNFEEWYLSHPKEDVSHFEMSFDKIGTSGALFDMEKLLNLSRNYLSQISASEMYENTLEWAKKYNEKFAGLLTQNKTVALQFLNIEREVEKPRKDYAMYSEVYDGMWYMFNDEFKPTEYEWQNITDKEEIETILKTYMESFYDENDNEEDWFNKVKDCCDALGYASNMKEYKQNPENFKGNVADVSTVLRVAFTSKSRTPNLYDIMKILGKEEIERRMELVSQS